jgi:Endonuclease/Exonuclease/phosphatase family
VVDRWLTRRRLAATLVPVAMLGACGLGVGLAPIPDRYGDPGGPVRLPDDLSIAAVVAGDDQGFVLGRNGEVLMLGSDGSLDQTANIDSHMTPFGAWVGGRAVFGGLRCQRAGCRARVGELITLDDRGQVAAVTTLVRSERRPSSLNGLALVGVEGDTVWVNGGGTLFRVDGSGRVIDDVPWPGGEPCLVDGALYDLSASGGSYGQQGGSLEADTEFDLDMRAWRGNSWRRVGGGATTMAHGRNAYCVPGGYEIRDARATYAGWTPATGWRPVTRSGPDGDRAGRVGSGGRADGAGTGAVAGGRLGDTAVAPVTTSTGGRYVVSADGAVLDVTGGTLVRTRLAFPPFAGSDRPPALQVDDGGSSLVACTTSYRSGFAATRCALGSGAPRAGGARASVALGARAPDTELLAAPTPAGEPDGVHHYNLCSAACGDGVRPHIRDLVAWLVAQRRPAALSLNEACYDDAVQLGGRWPEGFGVGTGYVALQSATNCPGAVKHIGNQVVVAGRSDPAGTWAELATQTGLPCDHRMRECRGLACAESERGRRSLTVCSAHLEPPRGDVSVTEAQVGEYLRVATGRARAGVPLVLAGDFNLSRDEVDRRFGDAGFAATPTGSTMVGRDRASDEIDMIYRQGPGRRAQPPGGRYCDRQASDHCYLTAGDLDSR